MSSGPEIKMSEAARKRHQKLNQHRKLLGTTIIVLVLIALIYVGIVIASEGVGSAVVPIVAAALFIVSLARLWVWSADHQSG